MLLTLTTRNSLEIFKCSFEHSSYCRWWELHDSQVAVNAFVEIWVCLDASLELCTEQWRKDHGFLHSHCLCIQLFQPCQVHYYNYLECWSHVESYQTYLCLRSFYREQSCFPSKEYLFKVWEMLSFNMESFICCASNLLLWCMVF